MKYNCIYQLRDLDSNSDRQDLFFSSESLAFDSADKMGYKHFEVVVVRYYYDVEL